jgi:hypothetical protein
MDPPELASEPSRSRIGATSEPAPELRVLGWVMLGLYSNLILSHTSSIIFPLTMSNLMFYPLHDECHILSK